MQNTIGFYAGQWNSTRTLAKLELEFIPRLGRNGAYRITKVIRVYAGGKGLQVGQHIMASEEKNCICATYAIAKQKMIEDCRVAIKKHLRQVQVENRWIEDLIEMNEQKDGS